MLHDWTVLDGAGVASVIDVTSRRVASMYHCDADDLASEARILVTRMDGPLYLCVSSLGLLHHRLVQDLTDYARKEQRRSADSLDARNERLEVGVRRTLPSLPIETVDYDRELVEALLPAVWDESYCYGVRSETAPDPDMPRGSTNKATGGSVAAHVADVKRAWHGAGLTLGERRVLLLSSGLDWVQREIATAIGKSQQTVSAWLRAAVDKLVAFLNGGVVEATVVPFRPRRALVAAPAAGVAA